MVSRAVNQSLNRSYGVGLIRKKVQEDGDSLESVFKLRNGREV